MPDLNALMIFAKVVEGNGFSEAARLLKMPVSTVSRRVADLENQLGVRLLVRSTRSVRLTQIGAQMLEHARHTAELSDAVQNIASENLSTISGLLRLSAPPSLSDSLLSPLVCRFQDTHADVRVEILVTERMVDQVEEGIDLVFRIGALKDSALIARKLLTYRHQLLASPAYLKTHKAPRKPQDLLGHRLLAFARARADSRWNFFHVNGEDKESLTFTPHLSMNDYAGIAHALAAGHGIGELPPLVQSQLLRSGTLIEVMPEWRFRSFDLSLLHVGNRHVPRAVRVFKEFAAQTAQTLFPEIPK